jgi:hypothetical protein
LGSGFGIAWVYALVMARQIPVAVVFCVVCTPAVKVHDLAVFIHYGEHDAATKKAVIIVFPAGFIRID